MLFSEVTVCGDFKDTAQPWVPFAPHVSIIFSPVTSSCEEDSQSSWSHRLVTEGYDGYMPLRQSRGGHGRPTLPGTQLPVTQSSLSSLDPAGRSYRDPSTFHLCRPLEYYLIVARLFHGGYHQAVETTRQTVPCVFGEESTVYHHHHLLLPFTSQKCSSNPGPSAFLSNLKYVERRKKAGLMPTST